MKYQLIQTLHKKAIPVSHCCRILDVSRSGFYESKHRMIKPEACKTGIYLQAAFAASGQSYGNRRLATALENQGIKIGRYKVRRLMQARNIKPV